MPSKTWESTGVTGLVRYVPSGIYYHRFSVAGNRTYRSLRTKRYPTAKLKLAKSQESAQLNRLAAVDNAGEESFKTLGDLSRRFFARIERSNLKTNTRQNWEFRKRRLDAIWPEWEKTHPAKLTEEKLVELREKLQGRATAITADRKRKLNDGYSAATINQTLAFLRQLLAMARQRHVIFDNPFERKADDPGSGLFVPVDHEPLVLPSRSDLQRIFAELEVQSRAPSSEFASAQDMADMARFLAFSGMRHREATAARWEDWDEVKGVFRVRGTKSDTSVRQIPLVPEFQAHLVAMRERSVAKTGPILKADTINHALKRVCKKLGLPAMSMHTLRHYFATVCIESGVDIPTVSRWLGHADGGALAMRTYGHLRDEHSRAAAQRVNFTLAAPSGQSIPKPTLAAPLSG